MTSQSIENYRLKLAVLACLSNGMHNYYYSGVPQGSYFPGSLQLNLRASRCFGPLMEKMALAGEEKQKKKKKKKKWFDGNLQAV